MYVVTIARQGSSLFMWYVLYRSNKMYINRMVIGKSLYIKMKIMSRTIIFETANLSGNRQSEHLYYHILLKNLQYTMYFVTVVRVDYLGVYTIFKETNFYIGIL